MATYTQKCSAVGGFGYANNFTLYVVLEEQNVSIENNTSQVKYNVYCQSSGSGSINARHLKYFNINGQDIINSTEQVNVSSPNAYIGIASGTTGAIAHNDNGSKSISFSARIQASSFGVSASVSGTFTLTTIARASSVGGGSGNIGSTVTITINRASSSFTHTLRYSFGSLSGTIASNVGTSKNWTIPTSFYAQIPNAKSKTGTIYCDTYSGGKMIGTKSTTFTATASESACRPTVSATIKDTNSKTIALTGNSSKLVKYKSTAQIVITSSVKNSATLKSVTVNGKSVGTTGSITVNYTNVSTSKFTIVATDSRGYTNTSYVVTPSYVNYVPLTISASFFRPQPTTGEVQLTYSGNYFNSSFGSVTNTISISWKYKETTATTWTTGGSITPTLSGNTISKKTISLGTKFDYQKAYDFQITARDKLTTVSQTLTVSVGMPIFYWGKDFLDVVEKLIAEKGIKSKDTGNVGTAVGNGMLIIKRANNTEAPNNGVVLEYGNTKEYTGQLFIGDNAYQGIYYNGWSNGTRGKWRRLGDEPVSLFDNSSGTSGNITLSESAANFDYIEIFFYAANDRFRSSVKIYSPNGKRASLQVSYYNNAYTSTTHSHTLDSKIVLISGTSVSNVVANTGTTVLQYNNRLNLYNSNPIYIYKILGYR